MRRTTPPRWRARARFLTPLTATGRDAARPHAPRPLSLRAATGMPERVSRARPGRFAAVGRDGSANPGTAALSKRRRRRRGPTLAPHPTTGTHRRRPRSRGGAPARGHRLPATGFARALAGTAWPCGGRAIWHPLRTGICREDVALGMPRNMGSNLLVPGPTARIHTTSPVRTSNKSGFSLGHAGARHWPHPQRAGPRDYRRAAAAGPSIQRLWPTRNHQRAPREDCRQPTLPRGPPPPHGDLGPGRAWRDDCVCTRCRPGHGGQALDRAAATGREELPQQGALSPETGPLPAPSIAAIAMRSASTPTTAEARAKRSGIRCGTASSNERRRRSATSRLLMWAAQCSSACRSRTSKPAHSSRCASSSASRSA